MANPNAKLIATEQAAERIERAAERLTESLLRVEARMLAAAELLARSEGVTAEATRTAKAS